METTEAGNRVVMDASPRRSRRRTWNSTIYASDAMRYERKRSAGDTRENVKYLRRCIGAVKNAIVDCCQK